MSTAADREGSPSHNAAGLDGFGMLVMALAFVRPLWRAGVAPSWGGDAADMVAAFSLLAAQDGAYPLSTTLLHLWTALPLGNVPFRLLLLGALLLSACTWLGYKIAVTLCRQSVLCQKPWLSLHSMRFLLMIPALVTVGLLHSAGSLSVSATFQAFLCLCLLLLFLRLPELHDRPFRALAGIFLVGGFALFNHPLSFLWMSPCFLFLSFRSSLCRSLSFRQWLLLSALLVSCSALLVFQVRPSPPLLRKLESHHEVRNPSLLSRKINRGLNPMIRVHRSLSHRGQNSFVWVFWLLLTIGGLTLAVRHRLAGAGLLFWMLGAILLGMWSPHALHSDIGCLLLTILCSSLVGFALVSLGQNLLARLAQLSSHLPSRSRWTVVLLILLVLPLALPEFWFHWRKEGGSWSWQPLLLSEALEEPLPRGTLIVANSSEWYTLRLYRKLVEGQRSDLLLLLPRKQINRRGPLSARESSTSAQLPQLTRSNHKEFLQKLLPLVKQRSVCLEWFHEFPKSMTKTLHPIGGLFQWRPSKPVQVDKYGQATNDSAFAAQQRFFWKQAYKALSLSDKTGRGDLREWLVRIHLSHAKVYLYSARWLSGLQEIRLASSLAGQHHEIVQLHRLLKRKLKESQELRERLRKAVPTKIK